MRRIASLAAALTSVAAALILAAPAQAHKAFCVETVNPHGRTVPPAGSTPLPGPKGVSTNDGFYKVRTYSGTAVTLRDSGAKRSARS